MNQSGQLNAMLELFCTMVASHIRVELPCTPLSWHMNYELWFFKDFWRVGSGPSLQPPGLGSSISPQKSMTH